MTFHFSVRSNRAGFRNGSGLGRSTLNLNLSQCLNYTLGLISNEGTNCFSLH